MLKTTLAAALALGLAGALATTPARADVKEDYVAACLAAYGEDQTDFCTCKAGEALKLEGDIVNYIIAFYQDPNKFREDIQAGTIPEEVQEAWPYFVMSSNKICRPADGA